MNVRERSPATLADITEDEHPDRVAIVAIEPSSGEALGVARRHGELKRMIEGTSQKMLGAS